MKKKTNKKSQEDNALIKGKIDSKLANNFDGKLEVLDEEEAEAAQKAILEIRKYKESFKEFKNDVAYKAKQIFEVASIIDALEDSKIEILVSLIAEGHYSALSSAFALNKVRILENRVSNFIGDYIDELKFDYWDYDSLNVEDRDRVDNFISSLEEELMKEFRKSIDEKFGQPTKPKKKQKNR